MIIAGTQNPTAFRKIGIEPMTDFDDAWRLATGLVGEVPVTVVAPTYWSRRIFKFDVITD